MPKVTKKKTGATKRSRKAKGTKKGSYGRNVIYPARSFKEFSAESGAPLTATVAKELLGWTEEKDGEDFKGAYDLKDGNGKKIRLLNNISNRQIYPSLLKAYQQIVLRKQWHLNGETIIIGKTGLVLDGQHSLISVVLATQAYQENPEEHHDHWQETPYLEKFVVFGIEEDDRTVNTINNCKPRGLNDVIYRSEMLKDVSKKHKKNIARHIDQAVRMLWDRMGIKAEPYSPLRTLQESMDFLVQHPRIISCVKYVYEENGDTNAIKKFLGVGQAAALMYLMSASSTPQEEYLALDSRTESDIDFSANDTAEDFWTKLAAGERSFKPIRDAVASILDEGGAQEYRVATLITAFNCYKENGKIKSGDLELELHTDDETGILTLVEKPLLGGIDFGDAQTRRELTELLVKAKPLPPTKKPKKAPAKKKPAKKGTRTKKSPPKPTKKARIATPAPKPRRGPVRARGRKAGDEWAKGDTAWVVPTDATDPYFCKVISKPFSSPIGSTVKVLEGDKEWEVPTSLLHLTPTKD